MNNHRTIRSAAPPFIWPRGLLFLFAIVLPLSLFTTGRAAPAAQSVAQQIRAFPFVATVKSSANVRSGPSTEFPIISAARPGQRLDVYGCNADCSWYLLAENCWIAAFLVEPEQSFTPSVGGGGQMPTVIVSVPITFATTSAQSTRCPQTAGNIVTYAGPATFYPVVDSRPIGECIAIVGRNSAGDWYQLAHGTWIDAAAVIYADPIQFIPITDQIFTPTPPTPILPFTFTAEEQAYLDFMAQQTATYAMAWAVLESQIALTEPDLLVMQTSDWRRQTDVAIALIRRTSEVIRTTSSPSRLYPIHAQYLAAADYYDEGMAYLIEGIEALDTSKFALTRQCVIYAETAIQRAQTILDSIKQTQIAAQGLQATATPQPASQTQTQTAQQSQSSSTSSGQGCDPNYSGACIPIVSYDLNCGDIPERNFRSSGSDPHGLDGDNDDIACEDP